MNGLYRVVWQGNEMLIHPETNHSTEPLAPLDLKGQMVPMELPGPS